MFFAFYTAIVKYHFSFDLNGMLDILSAIRMDLMAANQMSSIQIDGHLPLNSIYIFELVILIHCQSHAWTWNFETHLSPFVSHFPSLISFMFLFSHFCSHFHDFLFFLVCLTLFPFIASENKGDLSSSFMTKHFFSPDELSRHALILRFLW